MEYILKGNIVINSESEASTYKEIIDGSPRGVYANLSALQTAFPTGTSGVYLTSDDGHWHYWNGTAWADGGVYLTDLGLSDEYYENLEISELNGYVKTDGTIDTSTGKHYAINVKSGEKYKVFCRHGANLRSYVFVDNSNKVITYYPSGSVSTVTDITDFIASVDGILYVNTFDVRDVGVAKYIDNRDIKSNNSLYNKSIGFFGDSITRGHYSWADTLEIRLRNKMTTLLCNQAVAGSQWCINANSTVSNNINMKIKSIDDNYDYCIISGGANDVARRNTLGAITSRYSDTLDTSTFCGALEDAFRWLLQNKLNCKFGYIITPKLKGSTNQKDFVNAIKEICEKYSVPYLDLCYQGGLTSEFTEMVNEYYLGDTFHPNFKGYKIINNKVETFIKSL